MPPGLTGRLAGIAYCPQAGIDQANPREHEGGGAEEQADPSCPAASEVGTVDVDAGAGPTPIYVSGHAYLAGPYKGAPLSLAIVTPAVAGPFDLGTSSSAPRSTSTPKPPRSPPNRTRSRRSSKASRSTSARSP